MTASLPTILLDRVRDRLVTALTLTEITGDTGGPLLPLVGAGGPLAGQPLGGLRVFTGAALAQLVAIDLVVPMFGVDSHMLFAFTRADDATPHFTLDSVFAGGSYAFHLDLIPRVDLGAHLPYLRAAYEPLTEIYEGARTLDGLSPANLSPTQLALMSPWMLVGRATEAGFRAIDPAVDAYATHWLALVTGGLPAAALDGLDRAALAVRDQRHRDAIFDPQVDPVWHQVTRLVGDAVSTRLRDVLRRGAR